jgi:hypothetical protein
VPERSVGWAGGVSVNPLPGDRVKGQGDRRLWKAFGQPVSYKRRRGSFGEEFIVFMSCAERAAGGKGGCLLLEARQL